MRELRTLREGWETVEVDETRLLRRLAEWQEQHVESG